MPSTQGEAVSARRAASARQHDLVPGDRHEGHGEKCGLETDALTITAVRKAAYEQGGKLMRLRKYENGVEVADVYGPFD